MQLELKNVHSFYGLSHILNGVTLRVGSGELVGLFGRNGVGKTTTLRTIAGWLVPSEGEILLGDVSLAGKTQDDIARCGVAFVPEDRRIFPGLSVDENLQLGFFQNRRISRAQRREELDKIYARFPRLFERRKQNGITLSGGEQQMLTIARALVGRPSVLLIDEPSEGLAPMIVDEIFRLLTELKQGGVSILLVEQNIMRSLDVVDRFYVMRRGEIFMAGDGHSQDDREALLNAVAI
ncbi:MAG: ABC transporter ATP-binding protein [Castellaniella sp.]|uniref:ABC transporter ATP-binding protein n=1 Tax=Castellaniella sp. TaxID=1955812 RepID=UPI00122314F1|nr:ABC transporter ATP-binding protein [Castellaniella sp.]TAN25905.1 MAG: ABC transporter ATP-binding protein [Castellaniella sp.]